MTLKLQFCNEENEARNSDCDEAWNDAMMELKTGMAWMSAALVNRLAVRMPPNPPPVMIDNRQNLNDVPPHIDDEVRGRIDCELEWVTVKKKPNKETFWGSVGNDRFSA